MLCPTCGVDDDKVVASRPTNDGAAIRRRRECLSCNVRFTTFERVEVPVLHVRKRSGVVTPFSRDKVVEGMRRAVQGRVDNASLDVAATQIEIAVRQLGSTEVTSEQVGLQVLAQLRDLDEVSYVRFASVYKDFQGPEDFASELQQLRKDEPPKDLRA